MSSNFVNLTKSVHYGYRKNYGAILIATVYIFKKACNSKEVRLFFRDADEMKAWCKANIKARESIKEVSNRDTKKLRIDGIIFNTTAK